MARPSLVAADLFAASTPSPGAAPALDAQFDAVPPDWRDFTEAFRVSPTGQALIRRVDSARAAGDVVFPLDVFAALRLTRRAQVRAVILGQDPYHGANQAHGLAFSVQPGVPIPPSLRNIRKELQRDLGLDLPPHGSLQRWAESGVLLLNTVLTVSEGQAASHAGWGWERLTDALIQAVAADPAPKVFMLWGAHAQRKADLIQASRSVHASAPHLLLQSNHPSPLSASRGATPFVGCGHFRQAQTFLADAGVHLRWDLA